MQIEAIVEGRPSAQAYLDVVLFSEKANGGLERLLPVLQHFKKHSVILRKKNFD